MYGYLEERTGLVLSDSDHVATDVLAPHADDVAAALCRVEGEREGTFSGLIPAGGRHLVGALLALRPALTRRTARR